jgi:hypothetical protein
LYREDKGTWGREVRRKGVWWDMGKDWKRVFGWDLVVKLDWRNV